MPHLVYLVKGDASIARAYERALARAGDFDLVIVVAKPDGLSSAYGHLADEVCGLDGRILPGLMQRYAAPRGPYETYETITLATFSGGYKLAERMLAVPEDADAIDAYVAIDSIHADFEEDQSDRSARDTQIAPFVAFAERAKAGEKVFWVGHSDVVTPQIGRAAYASTTQVAAEIARLAHGEGGCFCTRAFNVERSPMREHVSALVKWGPGFLEEAMKQLLANRSLVG